jgi:hypothetical protein
VKNRLKITSETKEWQKITLKPYIIWCSIGSTSLKPISDSAKQLYSNISIGNLPLPSLQSNRAVFFRIARLHHTAAL